MGKILQIFEEQQCSLLALRHSPVVFLVIKRDGGIQTKPRASYKTFSFHTLNGYWRYKSEVYLWIILTILTNDFDKLDTFIRWRTRSDYCSTNGLWRAMISYFPVVLLIILRNQSRTRNRTSHANPTDLLEAGTCFNHSWLL
jgi:hypothetical protein